MEDASAVDLDWYWRGWFFGTEPVDISLENVKWYKLDSRDPKEIKAREKAAYEREEDYISRSHNRNDIAQTVLESDPETRDFYNNYDRFRVTPEDEKAYKEFMGRLSKNERELLSSGMNFYELTFKNEGGLVMPLIIQFNYEDGSSEIEHIPAEIWRLNESQVTKVFPKKKNIASIVLDPNRETADIDESNNYWPRQAMPSRFELFQQGGAARGASTGDNPMKRARRR
jgi:hypothetical protein